MGEIDIFNDDIFADENMQDEAPDNAGEESIDYDSANQFIEGYLTEESDEIEEEAWAKDPKGIEIAERLLDVSKQLISSIDPVMNNADFRNELANIFVCMKYLEMQKLGVKGKCPNIYDIETEVRSILKQPFMNDISYDIDISIAAMNMNRGNEEEDKENLELIFKTIGKAIVAQIKAAKAAKSAAAARG